MILEDFSQRCCDPNFFVNPPQDVKYGHTYPLTGSYKEAAFVSSCLVGIKIIKKRVEMKIKG